MPKKTPAKKPSHKQAPIRQTTVKSADLSKLPSADGGKLVEVHRRILLAAPYNPRRIDPIAARRLRESLERSGGLIQPPVWNRRTGHIVGGHKRLEQEDIIQGTDDYKLTVVEVDMSEQEEIEANIRLNSPLISGEFDVEMLDDLLSRPDIEISHTGLDLGFLEALHVDNGIDLPDFMLTPEDREARDALQEEGMEDALAEALDDVDEAEAGEAEQAELDEIKRRKAAFTAQENFAHQSGLSFRVVCPSDATCAALLEKLGAAWNGEYIDGMLLAEALGIKEQLQKILRDERPKKLKDFKLEDVPKRKQKGKK